MNISGNNKDCENLFEYITYLLMVIFFITGYILFSKFKVESNPKQERDINNIIYQMDEDDIIKGFFADFEKPKIVQIQNY